MSEEISHTQKTIKIIIYIALICACVFLISYYSIDPITKSQLKDENNYVDANDYYEMIDDTGCLSATYFYDCNHRSYYQTISEGDISNFVKQFTPNQWINFVQIAILYKPDSEFDQFYNIEETLSRGCGDCEDQAMLMARGLKDLGFNVKLMFLSNHVITLIDKEQVDSGLNGIYKGYKPSTWEERVYVDEDGKEWYPVESTSVRNIGEYNKDLTPYIVYDV